MDAINYRGIPYLSVCVNMVINENDEGKTIIIVSHGDMKNM